MQWEDFVCPECGLHSIVRIAQPRIPAFPDTPEAPVYCGLCGWNGVAKDLAIEPE